MILTTGTKVEEAAVEETSEEFEVTDEATTDRLVTDEAIEDVADDVDSVVLVLPVEWGGGIPEVDATRVWPPVTVEEGGRLLVDPDEELLD